MNILVVDDNTNNLNLLGEILSAQGYLTTLVSSGQGALDYSHATPPALILMDVQMPGMSGTEALKVLKADPGTRHIPIIAVTALAMKGDEQTLLNEGFDAYISKPFAFRDILRTVRQFLEP